MQLAYEIISEQLYVAYQQRHTNRDKFRAFQNLFNMTERMRSLENIECKCVVCTTLRNK